MGVSCEKASRVMAEPNDSNGPEGARGRGDGGGAHRLLELKHGEQRRCAPAIAINGSQASELAREVERKGRCEDEVGYTAELAPPPAVFEVGVRRGRVLRFAAVEWAMLLCVGHDFGWLPEGAVAVDAEGVRLGRDLWYGLHGREDVAYRSMTANDMVALSRALSRAAAAVARESDAALLAAAGGVGRWSDGGATIRSAGCGDVEPQRSPLGYFVEQGVAMYWLDQVAGDLHDSATLVVHGSLHGVAESVLSSLFARTTGDPWRGGRSGVRLFDPAADGDDLVGDADADARDVIRGGAGDADRLTADGVLARLYAEPELRAALEEEMARAREDDDIDPIERHLRER